MTVSKKGCDYQIHFRVVCVCVCVCVWFQEFVSVAAPSVPVVVVVCQTDLSDWPDKPEKLVRLVLRLVSKLATCLKAHNQVRYYTVCRNF